MKDYQASKCFDTERLWEEIDFKCLSIEYNCKLYKGVGTSMQPDCKQSEEWFDQSRATFQLNWKLSSSHLGKVMVFSFFFNFDLINSSSKNFTWSPVAVLTPPFQLTCALEGERTLTFNNILLLFQNRINKFGSKFVSTFKLLV